MGIYKKNGKYYCEICYKYKRRHLLCAGCETEQQAKVFMANAFTHFVQVVNGVVKDDIYITKFKDLTKVFLEYSKANKKDYKRDKAKVQILHNYFGDKSDIETITPQKIENFKAYMQEQYSNAYVNRYLACLKTIFNIGIKNSLTKYNPMIAVKMLKEDNQKIRYLTEEEEKRLFQELPEYLKPIVTCALQTGLRKQNILQLRWELVDLEYRFIEVLSQHNKGHKIIKIPISDKLLNVLNGMPRISEYVFCNPKTMKPFTDINEGFKSACRRAKIYNFRFHDLRHTVATRLVEKGIDLRVVQELMAHSTIVTTQRYMHPTPKRKLEAIEVLNSYT